MGEEMAGVSNNPNGNEGEGGVRDDSQGFSKSF